MQAPKKTPVAVPGDMVVFTMREGIPWQQREQAEVRREWKPGVEYRTGDVKYTHEQALVWNRIADLGKPYFTRLAPCCEVCAAPEKELSYVPWSMYFDCNFCGSKTSSMDIRAGHIVPIE